MEDYHEKAEVVVQNLVMLPMVQVAQLEKKVVLEVVHCFCMVQAVVEKLHYFVMSTEEAHQPDFQTVALPHDQLYQAYVTLVEAVVDQRWQDQEILEVHYG